ncbi:MAG: hypothetical protein AAF267_08940 [Deinococcota bacterium]
MNHLKTFYTSVVFTLCLVGLSSLSHAQTTTLELTTATLNGQTICGLSRAEIEADLLGEPDWVNIDSFPLRWMINRGQLEEDMMAVSTAYHDLALQPTYMPAEETLLTLHVVLEDSLITFSHEIDPSWSMTEAQAWLEVTFDAKGAVVVHQPMQAVMEILEDEDTNFWERLSLQNAAFYLVGLSFGDHSVAFYFPEASHELTALVIACGDISELY